MVCTPVVVAALVALRVYCAFTFAMNSDEPQHLHVVWAWTQGLLPYRDVFDNHAPLFQLISAPLLGWLGERSDIVALMRLAMVPLYFGALRLTWYIGKTLWSPRVGCVAAVLAAAAPTFFVVSIEFRPDDLWMVLWLAVVAAGVSPRLGRYRAWVVGLLLGAALAVSLKTLLLIFAGGIAWLTMPRARSALGSGISGEQVRTLAQGLLATLLVPAMFAAYFASRGIWHEAVYGIFVHNLAPDLGHHTDRALRVLIPLLGYPAALVFARWKRDDDPLWRARCWIVFSSFLYLLLLYGIWPLVTHQDLLPVIPLLAVGVAAAIVPAHENDAVRARVVLATLFAAIDAVNLATAGVPLRNRLVDEEEELARVLALTRADDYVMDAKGESIFRRRPVYWALEGITETRMHEGSIVDDIAERLVATGTPLVIMDRLPPRDAVFVDANYLAVKPDDGLIHIAGRQLGRARAGVAVPFEIRVPGDYAIVTPDGRASGVLDGVGLGDAVRLSPGRHVFVPSADSRLAVVWSPALLRGLEPGELFKNIN